MNIDGWGMSMLDFIRAMNERPWLAKLLCRLLMGRYAYREFLFMIDNINRDGYAPFGEYGCRHCDYHSDPQPLLWWKHV